MLKAIFFDFGRTLAESHYSLQKVDQEFTWPKLKELGAQGTYEFFFKCKQQVILEIEADKSNLAESSLSTTRPYSQVIPFLKFVADKMGLVDSSIDQIRKIERKVFKHHQTTISLFPGCFDVLHWIRNHKIKLAVVSNWFQEFILNYLRSLDILSLFDTVMTSEKAGAVKADLIPFQLTLDKLDVKPQDTIHVGDNITQDGACQQLGIRYVYSTWHIVEQAHESASTNSSKQFDYTVSDYYELRNLLEPLINEVS